MFRYVKLVTAQRYNVAGCKLATASCFDFTVDFHFAVLNEQLSVATGLGESREFEELVELDCLAA